MSKRLMITIDLGTTSTKVLAIDEEGAILGKTSKEYPLHTPMPDRAEQDPEQIWEAVVECVTSLLQQIGADKEEVAGVSFSSAMHGLIIMDKEGHPLTRSITWADNRSAGYVDKIKNLGLAQELYKATGVPVHPMTPFLKVLWFKEHEPELMKRAHKLIGIKEYILFKLFGSYVMDYSVAGGTGFFDMASLSWNETALNIAGIEASQLPELAPATQILTGLKPESAQLLGLAEDTPFVIGASDGPLANLGIGATEAGVAAVTIGTSGAVRSVVPHPVADEKARIFSYALTDQQWVIGGAINNGGVLFRWVRDVLASNEAEKAKQRGEDPYDALTKMAAEVPAGAEGLLVLPLFMGERAPYWNANARGVFFGLSMYHHKSHMIRAVLEGICFAVRSVTQALQENISEPIREIRASGGFANSPFWCQLLSDVLNIPIRVPESVESSSYGAARLAWKALGIKEPDLWGSKQREKEITYTPNEAHREIYDRMARLYQRLYDQVEQSFDEISEIQQSFGRE